MRGFANWSIRYKLLALLLLLGVTTFAVTGTIAYIRYEDALHKNVLNQLVGTTRSKRFQIESYYRIVLNHAETLSDDWMFVDAVREFRTAYFEMDALPVPAGYLEAVREDYRTNFYPELQRLHIARPNLAEYLPYSSAAIQLQYLYIVKNPNPQGHRDELVNAGDGSGYSRVHEKYHAAFRAIVKKFGYYDLYLIDYPTGRILYDVAKDRDFATSLEQGPYSTSNLSKVVRQCLKTKNPDDVFISDFDPYQASEGEPTQYVASPIYDGHEIIGVFALQLSTAAIDRVMTGDRGWEKDGLGKTGESILIGSDSLLRSDSRQFLEAPQTFFAEQKAAGVSDETLNKIRAFNTTILQTRIDAPFVKDALNGKEGTVVENKLPGFGDTLVSYMPLRIQDLRWAIASQMTLHEALKPVEQMQRLFCWWGSGLLLLTVISAWLMTRQILRRVNALVRAAERVAAGDLTAQVGWKSR